MGTSLRFAPALTWVGLCACAAGEPQKSATTFGTLSPADESDGDGDEDETSSDGGEAEADTSATPESSSGAMDETTGVATGAEGSSSDDGTEDTGEPSCQNPMMCATATVIGMVSGDEASPVIGLDGSEPTWVSFQVTEDNDGLGGESLSFTATLTSAPGIDFDLFVYRGAEGGATGCGGTLEQSTSAGPDDVVHMGWGEGGVANGSDERAWVAAEIRPKNGVCDPALKWTLVVEGDT